MFDVIFIFIVIVAVSGLTSHRDALDVIKERRQSFDIGLIDVGMGKDSKSGNSGIKIVESCKGILPLIGT